MPKWHLAVAASKGVIIAPELGSRGNQGAWHLKPGRGVKVSRWCLCESVVGWKIDWIDCAGCVDCGGMVVVCVRCWRQGLLENPVCRQQLAFVV